jgi:regulator of nucleoside diphosphate kinase
MQTTAKPAHPARKRTPRVVIDAAYVDRLESMAAGAMARAPEMAERLLGELGRARIVSSTKLPANVVTLGNRVTWRDETTSEEHTAALVYPEHADIDLGLVSVMTPIGVALIGLAQGAQFDWDTRSGEVRKLTVIRVEPAAA